MNNKRILLIAGFFVVAAFVGKNMMSHTVAVTEVIPKRNPSSPVTLSKKSELRRPFTAAQIAAVRGPASEWVRPLPVMRRQNIVRQPSADRLDLAVDPKPYSGLRGVSVALGVKTLKERDYSPSMGEFLREVNGMVYFKPAPGQNVENAANVVYDKNNDRIYPVSSVLKISKATPSIRSTLNQSYPEYYYSPEGQTLYLSSSNTALFQDFNKLEAQGYRVSIEVMRGQHQSR